MFCHRRSGGQGPGLTSIEAAMVVESVLDINELDFTHELRAPG